MEERGAFSGFSLVNRMVPTSRPLRWFSRLCSFHLALQLGLLLRCQHFVQLGHYAAMEFLHLRFFLLIAQRSITGHRLSFGFRIRKDIFHLGLLLVFEIQSLHSGLYSAPVHSLSLPPRFFLRR